MILCGKTFAKNAVVCLNVLYGLVGFFVEVVGMVLLTKWILSTDKYIETSWPLYIGTGVMMVLTAFFGCYAALREKNWMLIAFAAFILTLVVFQVIVACYLAMWYCVTEGILEGALKGTIEAFGDAVVEKMFGNVTETNDKKYHRVENKECYISPLDAVAIGATLDLCSAFDGNSCASSRDSSYQSWYIPSVITIIGVPLIQIIVGCLALYLVIYLSIIKRRNYTTVPVEKPEKNSTSACDDPLVTYKERQTEACLI